jgi:ACR3 family arsenite efflux pump ArsB
VWKKPGFRAIVDIKLSEGEQLQGITNPKVTWTPWQCMISRVNVIVSHKRNVFDTAVTLRQRLFSFQGEQILAQPLIIVMLAMPILIQVYFNSGLGYWLNRYFGEAHCVAAPSALIGASNFFELAVAAVIGLFGFNSGAALATVVGVLVEVPVMLSVVRITTATKDWYERAT